MSDPIIPGDSDDSRYVPPSMRDDADDELALPPRHPVVADDIGDEPLVVPGAVKPASASAWSTGDQDGAPTKDDELFSPQSRRMISALEEAMRNEHCTQIDGFGPGRISAEYNTGAGLFSGLAFASDEEYVAWLRVLVSTSGGVLTWDDIEEHYGGVVNLADGSRLTIFLPPAARHHATFSLRKHTAKSWGAEKLVAAGTMDARMLAFLRACVAARVNILIVGVANSGKSTLLRILARDFADDEKVAVVEQVAELAIDKPLVAEYEYQPFIEQLSLGRNLDRQLYNGLKRLIVGEVHMHGLQQMLECMIMSEGSLSTYHALTTEMAGERMKVALQMEHPNMSAQTAVAYMRQAVELVVVMRRFDGDRRCLEIAEIDWRSIGDVDVLSGRPLYQWDPDAGRWKAQGPPDPDGRIVSKVGQDNLPRSWFVEAEDIRDFKQRFGS